MAMVTPDRSTSTAAAVVSSARIDSDDLLVDALRGTRYDLLTSPASETSGNSLNASLDRIARHSTSPSMATPGAPPALHATSVNSFETPVPTARELSARLASLTQSLHKGTRPPWQLGSPTLSPAQLSLEDDSSISPAMKAEPSLSVDSEAPSNQLTKTLRPGRDTEGHLAGLEVDLDALSPQYPRSLSPRDVKIDHPFDAPGSDYYENNSPDDRRGTSKNGNWRLDNEYVDRERTSGSGDRTFSALLGGGEGVGSSGGALFARAENESSSLVEDLRHCDDEKGHEQQRHEKRQPTRTVEAWLDDLKTGWAADFSRAFDSIGAKVLSCLRFPKFIVYR